MKNYFDILGLKAGATEDEIRRAYRRLSKLHHPDVNNSEQSQHHFIEIKEAYHFLINHAQRKNYEVLLTEKLSRNDLERREQIYKLWVEHQQRKARTRSAVEAAYHAGDNNLFSKKMWSGVNLLYNLLSLVVFGFILVMPIMSYLEQLERPESQQRPFIFFFIPALLGAVFIGWGYYYWFVLKTDGE